jgi:hypothetical protein
LVGLGWVAQVLDTKIIDTQILFVQIPRGPDSRSPHSGGQDPQSLEIPSERTCCLSCGVLMETAGNDIFLRGTILGVVRRCIGIGNVAGSVGSVIAAVVDVVATETSSSASSER